MALFNRTNFIFIHIYKCGGRTIRTIISEKYPVGELSLSHSTAKEIRDHCYISGGKFFWDTAFKFTFVRNPFDWVVSLYEFIRNNPEHENYKDVKNMDFNSFCEWNCNVVKENKQNSTGNFHILSEFVYDENGKCLVDFIGKMETFQDDMNEVCKRLNIAPKIFPVYNKTIRKKDYRKYYDRKSREIIEHNFYLDFVNFKYEF